MTSSIDNRRQPIDGDREPSLSAERSDLPSIPGSLVGLEINQGNETPELSDAQRQSTSEIKIKCTERGEEEVEGRQQEEVAREGEALHQIRKDLEDTTGFGSYAAYLESLRRDPMYAGCSYRNILNGCFHGPNPTRPGVDIIDVSNEDLSPVGVSLRGENLSASEISRALCHPPPNTRAQIVLWPIDIYTRDIEDFLDVLDVGLQLDPCFFEALMWRDWREEETKYTQHFRPKNSLCIRSIGTSVFVARSFALAQDHPVPVVLIAGPMHTTFSNFNDGYPNKAMYDLVRTAPLYRGYKYDAVPLLANAYIRALFSLLEGSQDSVLSSSDILSGCIIPLLQIEIAICKRDLEHIRTVFHPFTDTTFFKFRFNTKYQVTCERHRGRKGSYSETPEYLYRYRTRLRSWIEYIENKNGALMGLLSSLLGANVRKGPFYSRIKEESILIAEEASRLEAEIRDHLQLQGGKSALEESRKSIELSNNQIHESKRVKIFTVLAFSYVPLNLATSIFGMNLKDLNGSGTSIGVFLATAGTLLFVTGLSWLSIEAVKDARAWVGRVVIGHSPDASQYPSIFLRLYLIWWLSRNGLFKRMIYTGAGLCLLINSSRFLQSQEELYVNDIQRDRVSMAALAMLPEPNRWGDILNIRRGRWLSKRRAKAFPSPLAG